jgi:hypothetical protein
VAGQIPRCREPVMRRIEEKAERGQQQAPSGFARVSSAGDPLNNYLAGIPLSGSLTQVRSGSATA